MSRSLAEAEGEARGKVNRWVAANGLLGMAPGSSLVLAATDLKMIAEVAETFGVEHYDAQAVLGTIAASAAGKTTADAALSFIPIAGWIIKGGVAAGITKTAGELVISYFKERSPYH